MLITKAELVDGAEIAQEIALMEDQVEPVTGHLRVYSITLLRRM